METTMTIITAATTGASQAALYATAALCLLAGAASTLERGSRLGLAVISGVKPVDHVGGRPTPRFGATPDVPAACRSLV